MALTKDQKKEVVEEVLQLLSSSKMTVIAKYQGTPVKAMQQLRRQSRDSQTKVKIVKNRLVIKALERGLNFKDVDKSVLQGMLLYAFNEHDEVAPAQSLNNFAKNNPNIEFVGAITAEGKQISAEEVKALALLPSKNELVAQIVATLAAPFNDAANALSGNLHGLLDGLLSKS